MRRNIEIRRPIRYRFARSSLISLMMTVYVSIIGSKDLSVSLWKTHRSGKGQQVENLFTLAGHTDEITCLDLNTDFNMIVSGSCDCNVMVWDIRSGQLRLQLSSHRGHIRSVSINGVCGHIITVTSSELRVYAINGELLAKSAFEDHVVDVPHLTRGCVVLAPPCAEWRDGVIAVTGHESGHILFWKLKTITSSTVMSESSNYSNIIESKSYADAVGDTVRLGKISRELSVAFCPQRVHRADITSLRLITVHAATKIKEFVDRSLFEESGTNDLFVGDADGYVSRWSCMKVDQLSQADLQNVIIKS